MITIREICFRDKPIYSFKCVNREKRSIYLGKEKRGHLQKLSSGNPDNHLRFRNIKKNLFHSHKVHVCSCICKSQIFLFWSLHCVSGFYPKTIQKIIFFCYWGKKKIPYLMTFLTLKSPMLALNLNTGFICEAMMCAISLT